MLLSMPYMRLCFYVRVDETTSRQRRDMSIENRINVSALQRSAMSKKCPKFSSVKNCILFPVPIFPDPAIDVVKGILQVSSL